MPKRDGKREKLQRFNLVTGQDNYSSQTAQNPATSRRVQSLIPSLAGDLRRELPNPPYLASVGASVGYLFEYDYVNPTNGMVVRFYFCATSAQLFLNVVGVWTAQTLPLPSGLTSNAPLTAYPQAVVINNILQLSDGLVTWVFDGTSQVWTLGGMPIPQNAPSLLTSSTTAKNITTIARRSGVVTVTLSSALSVATGTIQYPITLVIAGVTDTTFNGTFLATPVSSTVFTYLQPGLADSNDTTGTGDWNHPAITTNKYYWVAYLDQAAGRGQEQSDVSPISVGIGSISTFVIEVFPRFGTANITNGTKIVTLGAGGGGGPTNEVLNPTAFTNPDPSFGGFGFTGVTDTAGVSTTTVNSNSSRNASCQWNTWGSETGAYSALSLSAVASLNCSVQGNGIIDIAIQYSMDGGTTWQDLVRGTTFASFSGTFTVSLPPSLLIANLKVRATSAAYGGGAGGGSGNSATGSINIANIYTTGVLVGTTGGAGTGGLFTQFDVGQNFYLNGNNLGTVASVQNQSQLTLNNTWSGGTLSGSYLIAPVRATHWVLYASESENSQVGFQLAIIPIATMFYVDSSPFVGAAGNLYTPITRPIRNDPPVPSRIQTIHKNRIFRRRENSPRFFNATAYEEVLGNLNGSPQECTPGTDPNTLSDIVNEDPLNDNSTGIRSICDHGDALYLGSEKNIIPLYGQSIDSFTLSNLIAFNVGVAGRYAMVSTPHGLVFVSYDKKVYLYPSQYPPGLLGGDATQYLVELSRPLRTNFEQMLSSDLDNVRLLFYNYGRRNWLVLAYQDSANIYHTWVYDFETQGWFELQRGVVSLAIFETQSGGDRFLVGGDASGQVWVLDDLTGNYISSANLPVSTFRPALIDWGAPDHYHVFRYVEFEVDNVAIGNSSITVNYYLDPPNVDNLPAPDGTLKFSQVRGSNFFRGYVQGGGLCYRMMLEIILASDQNAGVIRGLNIVADEAASLIF